MGGGAVTGWPHILATVRLELWHPGRNWRGNVAQWIIYSQAFNSALAIPIAALGVLGGVSGWLKLFNWSTQVSLTAGAVFGAVFVLFGPIGGVLWKYHGIWRQQNEAGLLSQANKLEIMRWNAWAEVLEAQGRDPYAVFQREGLHPAVEAALHSSAPVAIHPVDLLAHYAAARGPR